MRTGRLDRKIEIQVQSQELDDSGQQLDVWDKFATVRADRRDVRANERFSAEQVMAIRTSVFRMRWISGVHEAMRVVDSGRIWNIKGIASNQRYGWLELTCEAQNPSSSD